MTHPFRIGPWTIEPTRHRICDAQGEPRLVGAKVMAVLVCLAQQAGEVVSKETLIERVWGGAFTSDESLTTVIYELRKALDDSARQPRFVETIRKGGYRLVAEVVAVERASQAPEGRRATAESDDGRVSPVHPVPVPGSPSRPSPSPQSNLPPHSLAKTTIDGEISSKETADAEAPPRDVARPPATWGVAGLALLLIVAVGWGLSSDLGSSQDVSSEARPQVSEEVIQDVSQESPRLESLAVLPLTHFGETCGEDAFTGGLTDMLVVDLAAEVPLEVLPSLATRTHGSRWNLDDVTEELDADLVIEGSVVRSAETLWLSVQLVDTASGRLLWGGSYERRLDDPLLVQRDLASSIAGEVQRIVVAAMASSAAVEDGAGSATLTPGQPSISP